MTVFSCDVQYILVDYLFYTKYFLFLNPMPLKIPILCLQEEEMFRPNMFFLLLLPPIIFESGYSLHKVRFGRALVLLVWVTPCVSLKAWVLI